MSDRAATDTIRGYFYQFDYSIERILSLTKDTDSIIIEGVEDIDIQTATEDTAVQCKYYAKTEYNHSVIAEPIRLMLNHYAEVKAGTKAKINYKLRGHYKSGQSKLTLPLTLQYLKDHFLTYRKENAKKEKIKHEHHKKLSLSDADLNEFITLLEIDIYGKDFDQQVKDILTEFRKVFSCSDFSAEYFYYNNALRVIKELSIKPTTADRTITKKDFLTAINTSKILFNEWFLQIKGERAHFRNLRAEYFTSLNVSSFERFFLIEVDQATYNRNDLKEILFLVSRKWSKLSKREPRPVCPYVYIQGLNSLELIELKKELIQEDFLINDGYDFAGADFSPTSIIKRPDSHNQIKLKIINEIGFIETTISTITKTKEIYQFYLSSAYYVSANQSIKHIQIQIDKFQNLKNII